MPDREKKKRVIEYTRDENYVLWYQQALKKSDMVEYCHDVPGCYVYRPWSFTIWEHVRQVLDAQFKKASLLPFLIRLARGAERVFPAVCSKARGRARRDEAGDGVGHKGGLANGPE